MDSAESKIYHTAMQQVEQIANLYDQYRVAELFLNNALQAKEELSGTLDRKGMKRSTRKLKQEQLERTEEEIRSAEESLALLQKKLSTYTPSAMLAGVKTFYLARKRPKKKTPKLSRKSSSATNVKVRRRLAFIEKELPKQCDFLKVKKAGFLQQAILNGELGDIRERLVRFEAEEGMAYQSLRDEKVSFKACIAQLREIKADCRGQRKELRRLLDGMRALNAMIQPGAAEIVIKGKTCRERLTDLISLAERELEALDRCSESSYLSPISDWIEDAELKRSDYEDVLYKVRKKLDGVKKGLTRTLGKARFKAAQPAVMDAFTNIQSLLGKAN